MTQYVHAAGDWPTNSHLIQDIARLHYLDGSVLDATHANGNWWNLWVPDKLTQWKGDFTDLPFENDEFDAVTYDPPYVCPGGRDTTTIEAFWKRYGMDRAPKRPAELQVLINDGLAEAARVSRGYVLCKVKDYITGGIYWDGTGLTRDFALRLRLRIEDRFEHVGSPGPQSQTAQVHARRNLSTLFVFTAASRPRKRTKL